MLILSQHFMACLQAHAASSQLSSHTALHGAAAGEMEVTSTRREQRPGPPAGVNSPSPRPDRLFMPPAAPEAAASAAPAGAPEAMQVDSHSECAGSTAGDMEIEPAAALQGSQHTSALEEGEDLQPVAQLAYQAPPQSRQHGQQQQQQHFKISTAGGAAGAGFLGHGKREAAGAQPLQLQGHAATGGHYQAHHYPGQGFSIPAYTPSGQQLMASQQAAAGVAGTYGFTGMLHQQHSPQQQMLLGKNWGAGEGVWLVSI